MGLLGQIFFMTTFLAQIVHHLPLGLQFVVAVVLDEAGPALLHCRVLSLRLPAALIRIRGEDGLPSDPPGTIIGRHWEVEVVSCWLWLDAGTLGELKYFCVDCGAGNISHLVYQKVGNMFVCRR